MSPLLSGERTGPAHIYIDATGVAVSFFEVTSEIVEHHERFAELISHRVPFTEADGALEPAMTPGAGEKVVVPTLHPHHPRPP
ncbi:hypothetical protein OHT76_38310 [Streptomyces sp. NBC_00287]|uniref:hypothetical protein n=1 Tax=Streptomyces sp. NBC_00287 TaxID=2975702 RepID=UPI002E2B8511|nr:hypothetical protein [Streptomyces sp. NBC_00287]